MNKKLLFTSLIIAVVVIIFSFYIIKYSLDPFGAPPKGTSPNCGPENRYKFDVEINSKDDFVNFLKTSEGKILDQYGNNWVKLDNFRDSPKSDVDWNKVLSEVKTENAGFITIYVLKYNPVTCSGFTLKMNSDGYVSVYGCCGI